MDNLHTSIDELSRDELLALRRYINDKLSKTKKSVSPEDMWVKVLQKAHGEYCSTRNFTPSYNTFGLYPLDFDAFSNLMNEWVCPAELHLYELPVSKKGYIHFDWRTCLDSEYNLRENEWRKALDESREPNYIGLE